MASAGDAPIPTRIGIRNFRENMSSYLRRAQNGSSFVIVSRNTELARLAPPREATRPRRVLGTLKGKIAIAADFDTLPEEILDVIEAKVE